MTTDSNANPESSEPDDFSKQYSENWFWEKVKKYALSAGREVIEKGVTLFYTLQDPETPKWAKIRIIAALGYFISPLDAIPDLLPGVGYSDDLGVLALAIASVYIHIKPKHTEAAKKIITSFFGPKPKTKPKPKK